MPLKIMRPSNPYPRYVYHADHNEPIRVDNKAEETNLLNQGWTTRYLHKEYPKWINGKIVHSKEEEAAEKDKGDPVDSSVEDQDQKAEERLATAQTELNNEKRIAAKIAIKIKPRKKRGRGKAKKPKIKKPEVVKTTLIDGQEDSVVGERPEISGKTPEVLEVSEIDEDFPNQSTAG